MSTLLGMFAKYWQPGQVKSRLAATLDEQRAAKVQRLFVEALVARLAKVADRRVLTFSPPERHAEFLHVAGLDWDLQPQASGDLGERMRHFFATSLDQADRVVLIGSDSPDLPTEHIRAAFEALQGHDVVLGPAADGGYYLVGAARRVPPIFEGIAWSTPEVWPQTIEHLCTAGLAWHELPTWYDVDDEQSLSALVLSLTLEQASDPQLAALLARLHALLSDRLSM